MTRIVAGLALLSVFSVLTLTPKAEKKSVGAELVPAGTLYSPGVLVGDTLYISGLQGTDPQTHTLPNDFGQEAKNCLSNVGRVLKDSGMDFQRCIRTGLLGRHFPVRGNEWRLQGVFQEFLSVSNDGAGFQA